jgi:DNA polymerase III delta subunit
MAGEALEPVYLIVGGDLPKIGVALRRLRARFDPGSTEQFAAGSGTDARSAADVVASLNALGLFAGGERLVIVEDVERWAKADVEVLAAYLESPTAGAVLALTGDPSRLPAGLEAACAKAGAVLRFDIPARRQGNREVVDYLGWVRARLDQAGVRADGGVAERLVELAGHDAHALQAEIDKLADWAAGESVGVADVERLVVLADDTPAWALTDAWGDRDSARALTACEAMLAESEPFTVAARLADHVAKVRAVAALLDDDVPVGEVAKRLGLKPHPARKLATQARARSADELGDTLVRLAALDFALKGGSRVAGELELERAIAELTPPPEPR